MNQNPKAAWYLCDGEAKYWDGKSWQDFVWSNPPGSYDFPNGSGFWNGETFSSYDYVDFKKKRHQHINPRLLGNLSDESTKYINEVRKELEIAFNKQKKRKKLN